MSEIAAPAEASSQDLEAWVGRKETIAERIAPDRVAALGATLGRDGDFSAGAKLPPGWHWIFLNRVVPRSELGVDGHPKRGGFLPPVSLPRRMWAGGRLNYERPLIVGGEQACSTSGRRSFCVFHESVQSARRDDPPSPLMVLHRTDPAVK